MQPPIRIMIPRSCKCEWQASPIRMPEEIHLVMLLGHQASTLTGLCHDLELATSKGSHWTKSGFLRAQGWTMAESTGYLCYHHPSALSLASSHYGVWNTRYSFSWPPLQVGMVLWPIMASPRKEKYAGSESKFWLFPVSPSPCPKQGQDTQSPNNHLWPLARG